MVERYDVGGNSLDPTHNVRRMVDEASVRFKEALEAQALSFRIEVRRIDEAATSAKDYSRQLAEAEAQRINAIRAVDVAAVATATSKADQTAVVLADRKSVV